MRLELEIDFCFIHRGVLCIFDIGTRENALRCDTSLLGSPLITVDLV